MIFRPDQIKLLALGLPALPANKGGGGTQTTKVEIPDQIKPYVTPYLQQAQDIANTPYQAYTGQRVADPTADQTAAYAGVRNLAQGTNYGTAAQNAIQGIASGNDANWTAGINPFAGTSNPFLQKAIDANAADITRQFGEASRGTDGALARHGAFGGSAWQQQQEGNARQLATGLSNNANNFRMADYTQQQGLAENQLNRDTQQHQAGQNNILQAAALAPSLQNSQLQSLQALLSSGTGQQNQVQTGLDNSYQSWLDSINYPKQQNSYLGQALGIGTGFGGGSQTASNNSRTGGLSGAAGGALLGAQLGSIFPGVGTGIGAGVGGAAGLLGLF